MVNLLADLPSHLDHELVTEMVSRPGVRIERIVSTGHTTPVDAPYDQADDEWVVLLSGNAELWLEGKGTVTLVPGDQLLLPAGCRHRVLFTSLDEPTVWLAVHIRAQTTTG